MWLNESEQELRRDLQGVASDLRWSAVELLRITEQLNRAGDDADAQAMRRLRELLETNEKRLLAYADEVKARHIKRTKADQPPGAE